mgnify:CR=1 FL=1
MAKKKNNNMVLWESVCETDPKYTKKVNQRGGFTAIGAQSQVMKATEMFGAFGYGWGVREERIERWENCGLVVYQATLWFLQDGKAEEGIIPLHSSIKYSSNGRIDDDFFKKVATDALTKGLSKLGFNADVFMGMFDDNKYVNQISDKYKENKAKLNGALTKQVTPLTDKEKESVLNMMEKTISKDDDFYKKVEHALKTNKITKENVDSSLHKITDYIDSRSEVSSE